MPAVPVALTGHSVAIAAPVELLLHLVLLLTLTAERQPASP